MKIRKKASSIGILMVILIFIVFLFFLSIRGQLISKDGSLQKKNSSIEGEYTKLSIKNKQFFLQRKDSKNQIQVEKFFYSNVTPKVIDNQKSSLVILSFGGCATPLNVPVDVRTGKKYESFKSFGDVHILRDEIVAYHKLVIFEDLALNNFDATSISIKNIKSGNTITIEHPSAFKRYSIRKIGTNYIEYSEDTVSNIENWKNDKLIQKKIKKYTLSANSL